RVTFPPPFSVLVTASMKESMASFACVLVIPASSAILAINSALFIVHILAATNLEAFSIRQNFYGFRKVPAESPECSTGKDFGRCPFGRSGARGKALLLKPLSVKGFIERPRKGRSLGHFRPGLALKQRGK